MTFYSVDARRRRARATCRRAYDEMRRSFRTEGLDGEALRASVGLSSLVDGRWFLDASAYQPTGMALGVPLPEPLASDLWSLATSFEQIVRDRCGAVGPTFAFVPRAALHITVVNRWHYESPEAANDGAAVMMTPAERDAAAGLVEQVVDTPLDIELRGLLLTPSGRLVVPGYPPDALHLLRMHLVAALPQLGSALPVTAHVKLGHLLADLSAMAVADIERFMAKQESAVARRATFYDLHTPAGRIAFARGR